MGKKEFNFILYILLFTLLTLSGCWDVEEITRRGIANAVFFDTGNAGKVKMGVSLAVPGSQVPPNVGTIQQFAKRNFVITGEGDSMVDAWREVQANTQTDVFFGQIRAIVLSENLVHENINDLLDFIGRIPLVPPNTNVLVTKSDPAELLNLQNQNNEVPGNYIDFYLRSFFKKSLAIPVDLWRINSIIDKKAGDLFIPVIEESQKMYKITGTALFSSNHFVDELSLDETQTLAMLKGTDVGYLTVPLEDSQYAAFKNVHSTNKIISKLSPDGKLTFYIKSKVQGVLVENVPHREILLKQQKEIQNQAKMLLQKKVKDFLSKLQSLNSDPVDFGDKFRIAHPRLWKKIEWHQIYPTAKFKISLTFTLKETGLFR